MVCADLFWFSAGRSRSRDIDEVCLSPNGSLNVGFVMADCDALLELMQWLRKRCIARPGPAWSVASQAVADGLGLGRPGAAADHAMHPDGDDSKCRCWLRTQYLPERQRATVRCARWSVDWLRCAAAVLPSHCRPCAPREANLARLDRLDPLRLDYAWCPTSELSHSLPYPVRAHALPQHSVALASALPSAAAV